MQNKTLELVFILDKSGSMEPLTDDTIGGFNSNLEKYKEDGESLVTTVLFDSASETIHDRIPIAEVPHLTRETYRPWGNTALYDAVGSTIKHIEDVHRYIRPEDVPQAVLFVIITDGMENSSRNYYGDQVRSMVEKKKADGWDFIFIGAGIDAFAGAQDIGISPGTAFDISADRPGVIKAFRYARAAGCASRLRKESGRAVSFEEALRKEIEKEED